MDKQRPVGNGCVRKVSAHLTVNGVAPRTADACVSQKAQEADILQQRLLQLWPVQQTLLEAAASQLRHLQAQAARQQLRFLPGSTEKDAEVRQQKQSVLSFASMSASAQEAFRKPLANAVAKTSLEGASRSDHPQEQGGASTSSSSDRVSVPGKGALGLPLHARLKDPPIREAEASTEQPSASGQQKLVSTEETGSKVPKEEPRHIRNKGKHGGQPGWWTGKNLPEWLPKRIPNLQPFWVVLTPPGQPDKKRLMTVQDFFKYTEGEGRQFWYEMDRDQDERISVDDVKAVLRQRKLPESYANDFIKAARGNRWWSNSIGWDEFKALVDEREPKMLRAFTSMEVNPDGGLEQKSIKGTLAKVGVAATDEHAKAMIKALGVEDDGVVSYGKFRNFLILLPEAKLTGIDPSAVWFESATMVPFGPPPSERNEEQRTARMLLTAALAGGIASCVSTVGLFPLDTLKTRLQSTAGASIASIAKSAPSIGLKGLYRGIIPAACGNFVSHGVRTFSYEASFATLSAFTGGAAELQLQGLSAGIGTFLGTCIRIPCEVLKQRLQTGRHDNVIQALGAATKLEGPRGLFRGTVATLSREVPFYVMGIIFFEQLKKFAKGTSYGGRGRELAPYETIALGALAGALASVGTTPADVMKTRVMTAAVDKAVDPKAIFISIIQNEGVGALFKGALFRAAWTAPQGALNLAGYDLAKKALNQQQQQDKDFQLQPAGGD